MPHERSRRRWWLYAVALAGAAAAAVVSLRHHVPLHWQMPLRNGLAGVEVDDTLRLRMRDGVRLASTLYLPSRAARPLATVYVRLPYDRKRYDDGLMAASFFTRHGYAVLVQDVRGKYESEGEFVPWAHATEDGVDTLEWIVAQPWSNGRVGTFGCSALGELQYALARARHPAHRAMVAMGAGGAIGSLPGIDAHFGFFEGGVFQLASGYGWFLRHGARSPASDAAPNVDVRARLQELPVVDLVRRVHPVANAYEQYLSWPLSDPRWRGHGFVFEDDRLDVPVLDVNTWGDQTVHATLALAAHARSRPGSAPVRHHVILAPGDHCELASDDGPRPFGELTVRNASQPYPRLFLRWFDHWLRDAKDDLDDLPAYHYHVIGEDRWFSSDRWPPQGVRIERWHLASERGAHGRTGDGQLRAATAPRPGEDEYVYDPLDPVPSRGGPWCCTGDPGLRAGPADQSDVESRKDVLVYTSAVLTRSLRIVGPLRLHLVVSSDAPDTDFVGRLVHVWPDGRATSIQEGALRARYRHGMGRPALMEPGRSYEMTVDLRAIAYLVPAGHRVRLQVTSSSFPRLERNLNTGARDHAAQTQLRIARNRVHYGPQGSYLELPVLEDGAEGPVAPK